MGSVSIYTSSRSIGIFSTLKFYPKQQQIQLDKNNSIGIDGGSSSGGGSDDDDESRTDFFFFFSKIEFDIKWGMHLVMAF